MTAILRSTPPPQSYVKQTRPLAWLRLGKAAVFSVLAGLAVAGGLVFPGGEAEAQGARGGYTYTSRVCQEYGQQPRWYNVRDGQAAYNGGNSDSGWLIVLEGGSNVFPAQYEFSNVRGYGTFPNAQLGYTRSLNQPGHRIFTGAVTNTYGLANGEAIIATDGTRGFVSSAGDIVVIDRNDNGVYDVGDLEAGLGGRAANVWSYVAGNFTRTAEAYSYGAQYVRWADMMWCR